MTAFDPSLYLVTDRELALGRSLEYIVAEAIAGGVTMVQLREKDCTTGAFIDLAQRLLAITRPPRVPLIINDRLDVALAVDADGVHVGQSDMPPLLARRLIGPDKILGLSVESLADAVAAEMLEVDYLGVSPVFLTATKPEATNALGLEGLREIRRISRHPLVAIGGMNQQTAASTIAAGADGIAVVSAICSAPDPRAAAAALNAIIKKEKP
jgi:thiamine-phosphate pyrophosphorylase